MATALIGHTGFVGSNLRSQRTFDAVYNSTNIGQIDGQAFDAVICAGVMAVKWWANQNPDEDRIRIKALIRHLDTIRCRSFTLISTVDVYKDVQGVTEKTPLGFNGLHAYGRNRAMLEGWVTKRFPESRIVRLPALFGNGLKKNAIYDLMTNNRVSFIHPESRFQWYPLSRLSNDLAVAETARLQLLNLSVEPVSIAQIGARFFPTISIGGDVAQPAFYDMLSQHSALFGGQDGYIVSAEYMMMELDRFLHRQPSA